MKRSGLAVVYAALAAVGCSSEPAPSDEAGSSAGTGTGADSDTGDSTTGGVDSSSGTSGGTETGETSTGPGVACEGDAECVDAAAPFCVGGECVSCAGTDDGDAACAALDGATPVCAGEQCVQCTAANADACEGTTPVCDEGTNACVGCTEHAQCEESACDVAEGSCLGGMVLHVDGDDDPADETPDRIEDALDQLVAAGGVGTIVLHEQANDVAYQENRALMETMTVAIIAAAGENPIVQGTDGSPTLTVPTGSRLYLEGLRISGNGVGVFVDGGVAHVSRSRVVNNTGGGITVANGGALTLVNSMVGQGEEVASVDLAGGSASVLYSAIIGGSLTGQALTCSAASTVAVRNSIVVKRPAVDASSQAIACDAAEVSYSLVGTAVGGIGNVLFEDDPVSLLIPNGFSDGRFFLASTDSPAAGVAQWQAGDPTTDIEGDARPSTAGEMDYAGADVPQP